MSKKQKGQRENEPIKTNEVGHRIGTISKIIKLNYIAEIQCWCGNKLIIDSSKSIEKNVCSRCNSPYKLIKEEWTHEEMNRYLALNTTKKIESEMKK